MKYVRAFLIGFLGLPALLALWYFGSTAISGALNLPWFLVALLFPTCIYAGFVTLMLLAD